LSLVAEDGKGTFGDSVPELLIQGLNPVTSRVMPVENPLSSMRSAICEVTESPAEVMLFHPAVVCPASPNSMLMFWADRVEVANAATRRGRGGSFICCGVVIFSWRVSLGRGGGSVR